MFKQLFATLVLMLLALPLSAQVKVTGKVTDENNSPLPGASILAATVTKDTVANTINVKLDVPAANGNFTSSVRQKVSLKEVFLYFDVSTAASMKGIEGTPNPGNKTDATQPLTYEVTSASGTPRKWTVTIEPLPIINRFDGNYVLTGTMVDYTNNSLTGKYPANVALITQSENSVALYDFDVAQGYGHSLLSGSLNSHYGQFAPVFTIDDNNKVVSVTNYFGQPSSNGRSAELDPSGENVWDPASKTLKVKYWMNQTGLSVPHRVSFDEVFTWKE
ncbi:DUF5018-related domain-containing protein [Capnocytophaga stomatis]|uniref:DUF5018-related domain-containing protein n=1 Tax=Capnocytophaga stomatis TaxID=1848904 RepID=A0ABW8QAH9_9FLAO|nr:carboxypeptidase-like regulatory domain-containing protein [Capnocytophaga stomatis]GIJ94322.1 hypothetical protein CAPN002_15400 [Capnocytophaga stomatis]